MMVKQKERRRSRWYGINGEEGFKSQKRKRKKKEQLMKHTSCLKSKGFKKWVTIVSSQDGKVEKWKRCKS
jgi:hypothetical protein